MYLTLLIQENYDVEVSTYHEETSEEGFNENTNEKITDSFYDNIMEESGNENIQY